MAELDYAYLAEYATVQSGRLTAVGASFTHLALQSFDAPIPLAVAGRIRAAEGTDQVELEIEISGPGEFVTRADFTVAASEDARPYKGRVGIVFAANTLLPVLGTGLYEVRLSLDGEEVRLLAFDLEGPVEG